MSTCDQCKRPATWSLSAAYRSLDYVGHVHPLWATYPAPMALVCDQHLAAAMTVDQAGPGATSGYLTCPLGPT